MNPETGGPPGPARDSARVLREEVDRIRRAERSAREVLRELELARRRLEALVGAGLQEELGDEPALGEARAAAAPDGADAPSSGGPVAADSVSPEPGARLVPVLVAALVLLSAAGLAGWLVLQDRWDDEIGGIAFPPSASTEDAVGTGRSGVAGPGSEVAGADPPAPEEEGVTAAGSRASGELPTPDARAALYDSLFAARSDLFDPLLEELAERTGSRAVEDAVEAWRDGGELDPLTADRLHSALLQLVLRRETGRDLALDGQVLRNPCRGASCGAFMGLWESEGPRLGFPELPADVARGTVELGMAERVLLLRALNA